MSARGRRNLGGVTTARLTAMGPDYHARYSNPDEAHEYVPQVMGLLERNGLHYAATLQQVCTGPHLDFA